jgi:hypothetical protein
LTSLNAVSTDLNLFANFSQTVSWTAIASSTLGPSIIYRADSHQCDGCNIGILRNGNELSGFIAARGRYFTVRPEKTNKGDFLGTRISEIVPVAPANSANDTLQASGISARIPANTAPLTPVTIDILAVLSPQALALDPAALKRDEMLTYYNNALSSSNSNITARYVGQYVQPGIEELPGDLFDWLRALGDPRDGIFDQVHQQRDLAGADFVAAFTTITNRAFVGVAFELENILELHPSTGFSVTKLKTEAFELPDTLAHELGHAGGAGHHPGDPNAYGLYPYSRGSAFGQLNTPSRGRDIMTYQQFCGISSLCTNIGSFSSPEVFFMGNATGITGVADNALTLRQSAQFVAAIRPAGGIGNRVDISTRFSNVGRLPPLTGPGQLYQNPFVITNTTTNTANNVQVTIEFFVNDVPARIGQQTGVLQEVWVQPNPNQSCTRTSSLPPTIRYVCSIGSIAPFANQVVALRFFNTGPLAWPVQVRGTATASESDYRNENNFMTDQFLIPYE